MRTSIACIVALLNAALLLVFLGSVGRADGPKFLESYLDPRNPQTVFAIYNSATPDGVYLLHSRDGGRTWSKVRGPTGSAVKKLGRQDVGDFFITLGPPSSPRLIITYGAEALWRASPDLQWQRYTAPGQLILKLAGTAQPDSFFAIAKGKTGGGLFLTSTGGASWLQVNDKLPFDCTSGDCTLATSPDGKALVGEGYVSRDGGRTWGLIGSDRQANEGAAIQKGIQGPWPISGTPDQVKAAGRAVSEPIRAGEMPAQIPSHAIQPEAEKAGRTPPEIHGIKWIIEASWHGQTDKGACRGPDRPGQPIWIDIHGTVPPSIDLTNDETARAIFSAGREYAIQNCPPAQTRRFPMRGFNGWLYTPDFQEGKKPAVASWAFNEDDPVRGGHLYSKYTNFVQEEARRIGLQRAAERRLGQEIIARTVEGFTLGMDISRAIEVVTSGIRRGIFKLVPVGPFPIPALEAGRPIVSEGEITVGGEPFRIMTSASVSSATAREIQLRFYESRLFELSITPYAPDAEMHAALGQKYGPPTRAIPNIGGGQTVGDEWVDKRTIVRFYRVTLSGATLSYQDRELYALMEERAAEIRRQRDEEEKRKLRTLPRGY
jgi:hypothetical protein